MKKRIVALLVVSMLFINVVIAESYTVQPKGKYQSEKSFAVSSDYEMIKMAYGLETLGELKMTAFVLHQATGDDVDRYTVKNGTSATFSYVPALQAMLDDTDDMQWHVVSDGTKKVGDIRFKKSIKKGGLMVERSYDGQEWSEVFNYVNALENPEESLHNFYTAPRNEIGSGCYYRITLAYCVQRKSKDSHIWFVDTSSYEKRWCVERYTVYLISDETRAADEDEVVHEIDYSQNNNDAEIGSSVIADETISNRLAGETVFNARQGHGFAAEAVNMQAAAEQGLFNGEKVVHSGANNAKNGSDYTIQHADGTITEIQTKYYKTANNTVQACFDNETGMFRYYTEPGVPMKIEVPADQYEKAVELMRDKISQGLVQGVTDPDEAQNIIREGTVTYQQALNIAKAGTIDSIKYDAKNGVISATTALGISATITFAKSVWDKEPVDVALKKSLYTGLNIGGNAFVTSVLSSQLSRTALNSLLVPGSEAVIQAIGPKAAAVIVNAARVGLKPIYGAAAMKSAAKLLRGNVVTATISLAVFTVPDVVDVFRGRISAKQLLKNAASTAGAIGGGFGGSALGAAIGTAVFPGVGTTIGGIVGALGGGIGVSAGVGAVADLIAEDDADEMLEIITMEYQNLAEEYLLGAEEVTAVTDSLEAGLDAGKLKDMYSSNDHHAFARQLLEPEIQKVIENREKVVLPTDEELSQHLIETLEEVYDSELADGEEQ